MSSTSQTYLNFSNHQVPNTNLHFSLAVASGIQTFGDKVLQQECDVLINFSCFFLFQYPQLPN